jgi:hypothetical protein
MNQAEFKWVSRPQTVRFSWMDTHPFGGNPYYRSIRRNYFWRADSMG